MIPELKLPYLALTEKIRAALLEFTDETEMEVEEIRLKAFRKENNIVNYNIKIVVSL